MTIAGGPDLITDSLVLHLDAANSKSYAGTGTLWTDLSGRGNHGTLVNGPSFSTSLGGNIGFDGTNDYLSFNASIVVNTNTGFTIDTWIYINDPQPIHINNWSYWYSTAVNAFEWGVYANGVSEGIFVFQDFNGAYYNVFSPYIGNRWANIVFGCNARVPFMYTNMTPSAAAAGIFRNTDVTITNLCRRQVGGDRNFRCSHSSIRIYNRALSANEVSQNYNALKGKFLL